MLLNNTFLETRIQQLFEMVWFFVEKGLAMHMQRMFEMSSVYTLAEILSKMFGKNQREIGDLIYDRDLTK